MRVGFGRRDITPRVGVELCGFGPYLNRRSEDVRDRLWARAMAVEAGGKTLVLVSCDLIGVPLAITRAVRRRVAEATGVAPDAIMVHCTHTHSGPATGCYIGWGQADEPYLRILPGRIARACVEAAGNLVEAELAGAQVPCEGIGLNREYDRDAPPLEEVLREGWRPAKPELTDTTCRVLTVRSGGRTIGFASYFSCHPVVCCASTRSIHGDYAGVATNLLEKENPGSTGLFLQGAQGDVNTCVVHKGREESLRALDVIAGRYASAVRAGLEQARPLGVDSVAWAVRPVRFETVRLPVEEVEKTIAKYEAVLSAEGADDSDQKVRMATVYVVGLTRALERLRAGLPVHDPTELQALRIGPIVLVGLPFEVFQAVRNDIVAASPAPATLVLALTNDNLGYATDRTAARRGGYAAEVVPVITGALPFADVHGQLAREAAALLKELR